MVACGIVVGVASAIGVPRSIGRAMILLVGPAALVGARLLAGTSEHA